MKRETRVSCGAAALPGQGASLDEEAVLADSGRAGEKSGLFEHPAGEYIAFSSEESGAWEIRGGIVRRYR